MECKRHTIKIETHYIDKVTLDTDNLGRLHNSCKVCRKHTCLLSKKKSDYEDEQLIRDYLNGEVRIWTPD